MHSFRDRLPISRLVLDIQGTVLEVHLSMFSVTSFGSADYEAEFTDFRKDDTYQDPWFSSQIIYSL